MDAGCALCVSRVRVQHVRVQRIRVCEAAPSREARSQPRAEVACPVLAALSLDEFQLDFFRNEALFAGPA